MNIKLVDATKKYKDNMIFEKMNISFESGRITGLVGRNGSGKTMLLKSVCGFVKLDEGSILLDSKVVNPQKDILPLCGYIINHPGFLPEKTGFQNLKLLSAIRNRIDEERILECFEMVGLTDARNKKVKHYSMGMYQRLGIAQAIMEDLPIIILDEPMNGLDSKTIKEMRCLIKAEKEKGKLIILTSHNDDDITELCDDVINMNF